MSEHERRSPQSSNAPSDPPSDTPPDVPPSRATGTKTAERAGLLGVGILGARLLGLVRDVLIAGTLGAGPVTDALFVALRLPNVLRLNLSEGTLNAAFVPVANEYIETKGHRDARSFVANAVGVISLGFVLLAVAGAVAAPILTRVSAPGFVDDPATFRLTVDLMRVSFLYLIPIGAATVLMQLHQSIGRFGTSAAVQPLYNIGIIAAILVAPFFVGNSAQALAMTVVVGILVTGFVQLGIQLPGLREAGYLVRPGLAVRHPGVRRVGRLIVPTLFSVGIAELAIVVNTLLASLLGEGAVSAMEYGTRVAQVPYAVVGGALATALLPECSRLVARGDIDGFGDTLRRALRSVVFVMVPVAITIGVFAEPVIRLMLERGAFTPEATRSTADALRWFAPLIVGASTLRLLTFGFFALQRPRVPVVAAVVGFVANAILGVVLMRSLGVKGLALAAAAAPVVASFVLTVAMGRAVGAVWSAGAVRFLVQVGLAAAACLVVARLVASRAPADGWLVEAGWTAAGVAAGLVAYGLAAALVRLPELGGAVDLVARRRGR